MSVRHLVHGRIRLALHTLQEAPGRPLLLLHGLGERSPGDVPKAFASWTGPVCALDFTGHGGSSSELDGKIFYNTKNLTTAKDLIERILVKVVPN